MRHHPLTSGDARTARAALTASFVLAAAALSPRAAHAQQAKPIDGEFSVQRFDPAPGPRNFLSTRGARTDGEMAWSAGLFVNYASKPFVVVSCRSKEDCGSPSSVPGRGDDITFVENLVTGDLLGSLTVIPRLQLGLKVPVSYSNGDGLTAFDDAGTIGGGGSAFDKVKGIGLGDPQLEVKFRAHGEVKDPFVVGVAAFVSGPLGSATAEGAFIGDPSPVAGLRGIIDGKDGPLTVGANLSGLYRSAARVGSTELGSEFRYNVAVGYEATPVIRVVAEGYGTTKFSAQNGTNSLEVDLGAMITPLGSPITVTVGGGPGVVEGVGVPTFRALAGVMYVAESTEADGDGIPDGKDQCPTEPEDKDGYEDADGCPEKDNDGDTIADTDDKCPMKAEDPDGFQDTDGCPDDDNDQDGVDDAHDQCGDKKETKNGFKDEDGCPDEPDQDGDGVPDAKDQCSDKPEDTDGFQDTDGCPDPDNDGDGIPDEDDECVDEPETKNGITDTDGCPDKGPDDKDSDGIPDKADKCPEEPEDKNGIKDEDGCPDALATVTGTEIEIRGVINFANNDTKIVGAKSYEILDAVAAIMKQHAEIKLIEVQGHTDDRGNADKNLKLSEGRAAACRDYLVSKGVEATRFEAKGYGQTKPVADNKTQKGRDQNRRVEFAILKK